MWLSTGYWLISVAEKDPITGWNSLEYKDFGVIKVPRLKQACQTNQ